MVKDAKFFEFESLILPADNTAKYVFDHVCSYRNCCFLCAASNVIVFVYL